MTTVTAEKTTDAGLSRAFWCVGLVGTSLSVGSIFVLQDFQSTVSVAVGAAIALLNFWMTSYLVRGFLAPTGMRLPWPLIATIKLVVVLGGVYVLLDREVLSLLPLVVGFGALPLGIVLGQTRPNARTAKEELSDA
jgi:hypothetical protein